MTNTAHDSHQIARLAFLLFAAGLLVHIVTLYVSHSHLAAYRFENLALHAAIEAAGALLAIMAAYLLWRLQMVEQGSRFNQRISAALLAMGVLDGMHSLTAPGQVFVWLHSSATLLGGLLFALVWLPRRWFAKTLTHWPQWTLFVALLISLFALKLPEQLPTVIAQGSFTDLFVAMNQFGGALMLLAAIRLAVSYQRHRKDEDMLFCAQCLLFGFGALVYQQSSLWNLSWWMSHGLRLFAYAVALWLLARVVSDAEQRLRQQLKTLELETANLRLLALSMTDALTGIANRRCFDESLQEEWQRASRTQANVALALIDVDFFKKYNDCYGHQAGDRCLQQVATVMKQGARRVGDLIARYGGEEFVFIAPHLNAEQLYELVNHIRVQLQQRAIEHHQSPFNVVTLSVGVSSLKASTEHSAEVLIKQADAALYQAKSRGRNKVVIYSLDDTAEHCALHDPIVGHT